jgi:multidrug transporter EmrE-like cation transporter
VLWLLALREVPLTIAYPFMGLTLVLVELLGVFVLGETLGAAKLAGMALVCAGLVLLARG